MRIEVTTFAESYEEALPLIEDHWEEVPFGPWKDLGIEVNTAFYLSAEEEGYLRVIVARNDDDKMIGYVVLSCSEMNHHQGVWQASTDVVYVDPEYRGQKVAQQMLVACSEQCKEKGITFFSVVVNPNMDFSAMLEKTGAIQTEKIYTWRL
jgi:ribosomal protein S18 acetylase RimI-like enzyme